MDIEAIALLRKQKQKLKSLPSPTDPNVEFEEFEGLVGRRMGSANKTLQKVSKYAEEIQEELTEMRETIKLCNIIIGEQIAELMKNQLLQDEDICVSTSINSYRYDGDYEATESPRCHVDTKKIEQLQALQRLAKQQQDLMTFIAKTELLVNSIEEDGTVTLGVLSSVTDSMGRWKKGLETIEEKKKRLQREKEEEERRKKEEERKKKEAEEAERRRKEQEEREREEKKRRLEEEKKKREWKNWPPFIYYNDRKNKFNQDIACVIFTMPDNITSNDLVCNSFDTDEDLDKCLEDNDEQILSSVISIKPNTKNRITFQAPLRVFVPIVHHDGKLEPSLKFSVEGKKWKKGKPLKEIKIPKTKNIAFVGVEIALKELTELRCVAVAHYKRDYMEIDEMGGVFEPEGDRNLKVKFPEKAFAGKTTVVTRAVPWTHNDIKNASKAHKELQNIRTAGSFIEISCENSTKEDSDLEMYDFGWVDKNIQKHQSVNQETLNRCSRWVVNNMTPDNNTLQLDDIFDSDVIDEIESKETQGDKNRVILRELHRCSESDFDKFVTNLSQCQSPVAKRITEVKTQISLSRKNSKSYSEDDFGNDFDMDFEKKEGNLCIVSKTTGKTWNIVEANGSEDFPKARFLKLPAGTDKYQVLGLVIPEEMSNADICRAAEILESLYCVTNVSMICRQKHSNPHDVIIDCVPTENVSSTIKHLDSLGYNDGPAESSSFGIIDGEEIVVKFESNLYLERYRNANIRLKFYKNIPFQRKSGHLAVRSKAEQKDEDSYHGSLVYEVLPSRLSTKRKGSMVVYVTKPLEEIIGRFAYTLNVPVKALAKFTAWQLTRDNFNSTRWVRLGGYLTNGDSNLYRQICQHVEKEKPKAAQRERCEDFILYWEATFAHYDPESDKIDKIIGAHHDANLEAEARQFLKPYTSGRGIFSNDNLEKMSYTLAGDWEPMAQKLGMLPDDINKVKSMHGSKIKQGLQMFDWWRLSDSAIQKGTDLVKSFHENAKSAKCAAKLLTLISSHV